MNVATTVVFPVPAPPTRTENGCLARLSRAATCPSLARWATASGSPAADGRSVGQSTASHLRRFLPRSVQINTYDPKPSIKFFAN